ncbi:relaxase/mobilization nuclease domain-containing protein [Aquibacillus koreensis]|uniref:Relaxase/mobilization nuclease domain-containing protein n=1 Tax=Aquibacillus koreensis TaxID=279446 RepID=A0A9X3WMN0_9BACI|nr:relaxase/mobilization nuclease domain-containing protein [Aquibacillus koreensis]MDC3422862.1 relaxase/mobilization nuclease domain-containing protein [Aquibacillus koreensis]
MAVIKLQTTKVANRLLSYCEKRAIERDGVECDADYAKNQFKATRELFGKSDGVQAHHVIQSFSPEDNLTPQQANEIGRELAERIAPGHECVVYTHDDKAHLHNHIVINAVSFENGRKYHSDRKQLYNIREQSNELCQERGLELVKDQQQAKERFSQAEYKAVERGEPLWKDELRTAVDDAKQQTSSLKEMQEYLKEHYTIDMKIQNKNVSFKHPEKQRFCRGKTLGADYTKGAIEHEHECKREIDFTKDRGSEGKLNFNEHVFKHGSAARADRGENERLSDATVQREQAIHTSTNGIGEGTERQRRSSRERQRDEIGTSESLQIVENRSQQTSRRTNDQANEGTQKSNRESKQGTSRTSGTYERTSDRASGTRDEIQTGEQTKPERNIDGQRITDRSNRGADFSSMGDSNTPSVSGSDLLKDIVKSVEQSAKQIEAQNQAEQQRAKQRKKPKTRTRQAQRYQELDGPER